MGASMLPEVAAAAPVNQGGFDIILQDGNTSEIWWIANYQRVLPSGAGWTDGDRSGYFCAYMFLADASGALAGRVTFTRVDVPREEGGNYAYIKDENMKEGARFYNGSLAPVGSNELGDCPPPSQSYEPWGGPDQRPTIKFMQRRKVLEIRDYKSTVTHPAVMFRQVESSPSRVTVVAYVDGLPTIVVYYDSMGSRTSVVSDIR